MIIDYFYANSACFWWYQGVDLFWPFYKKPNILRKIVFNPDIQCFTFILNTVEIEMKTQ